MFVMTRRIRRAIPAMAAGYAKTDSGKCRENATTVIESTPMAACQLKLWTVGDVYLKLASLAFLVIAPSKRVAATKGLRYNNQNTATATR